MLRGILLALLVTLVGACAYAQTEHKNEIGLLLGRTVTPSIGSSSGSGRIKIGLGTTFQLTYARQLTLTHPVALYFEVPALAIPLQDITAASGTVPLNYDSFFVTPALRLEFAPSGRISPWFSAGGGYALFDESANRVNGTHNVTRGTSGGALQLGGGVDISTPIKVLFPIGLRAEIRDLYTQKPSYNIDTGGGFQHSVVFSGGLVLHF